MQTQPKSEVEQQPDVREMLLANSSFGPRELDQIRHLLNSDFSQVSRLRDAVGELEVREDRTPAMSVRLGLGLYLLGNLPSAIQVLSNADGSALSLYYLGRAYMASRQFDKAMEKYQEAKSAGYDADQCAIAVAEAYRVSGDVQKAMDLLDQLFGPVEQTAEYLYQRGATVAAVGGNPTEVVALYERAVEANPRHPGALFGLALENDRRGNDVIAIELYQRSTQCFPAHVGALINLGVLYEDREEYQRATHCYERVLASYPDHPRARLFQKDAAEAADGVQVDPLLSKLGEQMEVVLNTPVTEFEMSVRARNCLRAMGIRTLGDLTRVTEQELLSSKNFGETSLDEIREIMVAKGLKLGQNANQRVEQDAVVDTSNLSPDEQALLSRPISELELSVRARKCMVRLGLTSIGELIRKTGDDLLECKNFGVTSLNEVKEKLSQYNLKLRGE